MGTKFLHKDVEYRKTGEEQATDLNGQKHIFEIHWGAMVPKRLKRKVVLRED